jgi:hypothetical protein
MTIATSTIMKITNHQFAEEEVILDFHEYQSCEFKNCKFVVLGYGPFVLDQCEVVNCEFHFAGPAASTIQTMATIYHHIGEQGKNLIEATFESIRNAGGNQPAV